MSNKNIIAQGKYLRFIREKNWEYVERIGSNGVVVIVPLTQENNLILVEQYRIPVENRTIELPAGLVGDEDSQEDLFDAARRELREETGFEASHFELIIHGPTSAGLTSESNSFVYAPNCKRVSAGGGILDENIIVHEISPNNTYAWIQQKASEGFLIDPKILAGLFYLTIRNKSADFF